MNRIIFAVIAAVLLTSPAGAVMTGTWSYTMDYSIVAKAPGRKAVKETGSTIGLFHFYDSSLFVDDEGIQGIWYQKKGSWRATYDAGSASDFIEEIAASEGTDVYVDVLSAYAKGKESKNHMSTKGNAYIKILAYYPEYGVNIKLTYKGKLYGQRVLTASAPNEEDEGEKNVSSEIAQALRSAAMKALTAPPEN